MYCTETLAKNEKAKIMTDNYPIFEWSPIITVLEELTPQIEQNETNNGDNNGNDNSGPLEDAIDGTDRDEYEIYNDHVIMIEEEDDNDRIIVSGDENDAVME